MEQEKPRQAGGEEGGKRLVLWKVKCVSVYHVEHAEVLLCLFPSFWEERFEMRGMY